MGAMVPAIYQANMLPIEGIFLFLVFSNLFILFKFGMIIIKEFF